MISDNFASVHPVRTHTNTESMWRAGGEANLYRNIGLEVLDVWRVRFVSSPVTGEDDTPRAGRSGTNPTQRAERGNTTPSPVRVVARPTQPNPTQPIGCFDLVVGPIVDQL